MSVADKPLTKAKTVANASDGGSVTAAKKRGRPSSYTKEMAARICAEIAMDKASISDICAKPGMPDVTTVFRWLSSNEDFRQEYAHAREFQAESGSHRMREIEEKVFDGQLDPNAARVILDSIKWRASKLAPKKYGDKLLHTGGDGESPVQIEFYMPNNGRESPR